MNKPSKKKSNIKLRSNFIMKLFVGWIISLFIPFFLLFIIAFVQFGDSFLNVLTGEADIWQRKGYSTIEQISRDINIWANGSPVFQEHSELDDKLNELIDQESPMHGFIIERRYDDIKPLVQIDDELAEEIQMKFSNLDETILPEFGARNIESNEVILEKTGFVLYKQFDYYYSDNSEGSIFIFMKYTNLPIVILKFIGENLAFLVIALLLIHGLISYKFLKKLAVPFNALLEAMKSYQRQDFSVRLNESIKEPMLHTINTAVNEMASDLQLSQENAQRIENQRIEFIAKISHDTKTPLASIRAHAEAFRDGLINDNEKRLKYTNNILKKVHSIDNMINELSLFSDLETGINQYTFSELDVNYYLMDILEELNYDYNDNEVCISYHEPEDKNLFVHLDVNRFNRVLMNIIKNSVWYSNQECTTIDIISKYDVDKGTVKISIKDNGKGVDSDNLEHLFESFTRGDSFRDPNKGGSGLGLAIAKTIVEKHGGLITANSILNEFFEIVIELPVERRA